MASVLRRTSRIVNVFQLHQFQPCVTTSAAIPRCHIKHHMSSSSSSYDYIIVGSGSAGSVIAHRLALHDSNTRVLVTEAGPPADRSWKVRMPAALMYCLKDPQYSWCYETVPQVVVNKCVPFIHS